MQTIIYYHLFFVILLVSCILMLRPSGNRHFMFTANNSVTTILLFIAVLIMGSLPILEIYSDRYLYAQAVESANNGTLDISQSDRFFNGYVKITGSFLSPTLWMYLTAFIYVFNHLIFSKKVGGYYLYPLFLMFLTGFFFYGYGVNTIRAGFAASFLLLALAFYDKLIYFVSFILIAVNCHFSMIIPALAMLASRFFDKTRIYLILWLVSIPLSAVAGHSFEVLFSSMSSDHRVSYLSVDADNTHYNVGFRIDFILYSCAPVILGYYYIIRKRIKDQFYSILYNTYILANCFWILVIRANFSDRFGYLSWFIYPAVLVYPALKYQLWDRQNEKVALIVFMHGLFTYVMFLR